MPVSLIPTVFFGEGYSVASNEVKFRTTDSTAAAGPAGQTFTATAASILLTAVAHGLKPGDRVQLTNSGGALPAGLPAASVKCWVATVPDADTFTISTTLGGVNLACSDAGTGTHTVTAFLVGLDQVTDAMATGTSAVPASGDWRQVVVGLMESLHHRYTRVAPADRSARVVISRSYGVSNGNNVTTYTVRVTHPPSPTVSILPE